MRDTEALSSIAARLLSGDNHIDVQGTSIPVKRTSAQHLRTATFTIEGREYTAIEQNPDKPSQWGQLARGGHKVVQFKDNLTNRFVAVCVDGKLKQYSGDRRD